LVSFDSNLNLCDDDPEFWCGVGLMNRQFSRLLAGLLMSLFAQGTHANAASIKTTTSLTNIQGFSVVVVQMENGSGSGGSSVTSKGNRTSSLTSGTLATPKVIPATPALTPVRTPVIVSSPLPVSTPVSIPVVVSTPIPVVTPTTPGVVGTPSPVPLPGALPLLAVGLGAFGVARWRKKAA
jgi:hypothetical protein